jgi:tetratricopeptide (TPR) repeat protein
MMPSLSVLLLVCTGSAGQVQPPPVPADVAKAIKELGDDNFRVREKATDYLWSRGADAELPLYQAAKSDDLETSKRALRILDKFRKGIYPNTPKETLELIQKFRGAKDDEMPELAEKILNLGKGSYRTFSRLLADDPKSWNLLDRVVQERRLKLVLQPNFEEFEEFLEMLALGGHPQGPYWYSSFLHLRGRIGAHLPRHRMLADVTQNKHQWLTCAFLHRAAGETEQAFVCMERAERPELLLMLYQESKAWKQLAKRFDELDKMERTEINAGLKAAYYRLAGDAKAFQNILPELDNLHGATNLLLNDEVEKGLDIFAKQPHYTSLDLWSARMQYKELFRIAQDLPPEDAENGFSQYMAFLARKYHSLGENAKRDDLIDKLGKAVKNNDQAASQYVELCRELGMKKQAIERAAQIIDRNKLRFAPRKRPEGKDEPGQASPRTPFDSDSMLMTLLQNLYGHSNQHEALQWGIVLESKLGTEKTVELLETIDGIVSRHKRGVDPLFEDALTMLAEIKDADLPITLAKSAGKLQRRDWEEKLLTHTLAKLPKNDGALLALGHSHLARGQWQKALDRYRECREVNKSDAAAHFLEGWTLKKLGKTKEGEQRILQAQALAMADTHGHIELAKLLDELDLHEEARAELRRVTLTGEISWEANDAYRQLAYLSMHQKDFATAADAMEQMMLRVVKQGAVYVRKESYLWVPANIHFWRARALAEKGDVDAAIQEARLGQKLLPGDSRAAIHLMPLLAAKGRKKEADELFEKSLKMHEEVLEEYPNSALYNNNLAWLLVRCGRDIDRAVKHARKAVELLPKHAGHMDTLAETLFQKGETAEAVKLMQECVQLEPDNRYMRLQLERMRKGDPKAPVPEEN